MIVSGLGHSIIFLSCKRRSAAQIRLEKKKQEETSPLEPWHFKMIFVVFFI